MSKREEKRLGESKGEKKKNRVKAIRDVRSDQSKREKARREEK